MCPQRSSDIRGGFAALCVVRLVEQNHDASQCGRIAQWTCRMDHDARDRLGGNGFAQFRAAELRYALGAMNVLAIQWRPKCINSNHRQQQSGGVRNDRLMRQRGFERFVSGPIGFHHHVREVRFRRAEVHNLGRHSSEPALRGEACAQDGQMTAR